MQKSDVIKYWILFHHKNLHSQCTIVHIQFWMHNGIWTTWAAWLIAFQNHKTIGATLTVVRAIITCKFIAFTFWTKAAHLWPPSIILSFKVPPEVPTPFVRLSIDRKQHIKHFDFNIYEMDFGTLIVKFAISVSYLSRLTFMKAPWADFKKKVGSVVITGHRC